MKLYYLYNGQDYEGPFNKEELKSKKITTDTPIWSEDMANWKKAGEIKELRNSIMTIPPAPARILSRGSQNSKRRFHYI